MKARLPQGYGKGPGNMQSMLKQAQKMQEEASTMQEELKTREYSAQSGGGMVSVVVTGEHQIKSLKINPEVVDSEDVEMLEDLIIAAVNEGFKQAENTEAEEMEKISGGLNGLNLPGLF